MTAATHAVEPEESDVEQAVTPLELFFDLVFVFAITQVTAMLAADPTLPGLLRGMAVLAMLWWTWSAYAWLTDAVDHDEGLLRLTMLVAMGAMLIAALAVPGAFDEHAALFAVPFLLVRVIHVGLYAFGSRDAGGRRAILRLAPTATVAPLLVVLAAFVDDTGRYALWTTAILIDYAGPYITGVSGFTISPGHFAERFGLIIIIALGESIVAIGVGAGGVELDAAAVAAAVLSIVVVAALWWAYFDVVSIVAARRLAEARGAVRAAMARDSYSYLHLPMIAGIVLVALGIKTTVAHVGEPLHAVPAFALLGGGAVYFAGHVAFRWRNVHTLSVQRLVVVVVLLALVPAATAVDALVALAALAAVCTALIAYEVVTLREARARVRAAR
jgi:low temperature requirement protein LtrA